MAVFRGHGEMEVKEMNIDPAKDDQRKISEKNLKSGLRLVQLIGLSFGLICVLQATLNISLRLIFLNADYQTGPLEAGNNVTRERDQLKISNTDLTKERDQLLISNEELTRERDDLQMRFCESQDGWKRFGPSCYYVSTEQKTWEESRQDCITRAADLVIIKSAEEQEFLFTFNKRVWIGLTNLDGEDGTWKWVDNTTLTTAYWNDVNDQPDNGGGDAEYGEEHCGELYIYYKVPMNRWNDYGCHKTNYWVCERRI